MYTKQTQPLIEPRSLAENDIQAQMFHTTTALRAGIWMCQRETYAEAVECCSKSEHAGPITEGYGLFGCYIDKGTGDWD